MGNILFDTFMVSAENELDNKYIVFRILRPESTVIYSYQVEMTVCNPRPFMIPFELRRNNGELYFYHNITAKIPLVQYLGNRRLSKYQFVNMLHELTGNILESRSLLLCENNFIISEDFLFIDPESGTCCMLYLPVELNSDCSAAIRDFVMGLITGTASIEVLDGDNYLQKIIESVKASQFNLAGFNKMLGKIAGECMDNRNGADKNQVVKQANAFQPKRPDAPPAAYDADSRHSIRKEAVNGSAQMSAYLKILADAMKRTGLYGIKTLLIAAISQLIILGLAFVLELLLKKYNADEFTKYSAIIIAVLVYDLLVFKHIARKNGRRKDDLNVIPPSSDSFQQPAGCGNDIDDNGRYRHTGDETTLLDIGGHAGAFLVCEREGLAHNIEIKGSRFIIGRNSEISDMVVSEKSVGRIHAEIIKKEGVYFIIDKNSKNGTYVNEKRLTGDREYRLDDKDSITFANMEYRFAIINTHSGEKATGNGVKPIHAAFSR